MSWFHRSNRERGRDQTLELRSVGKKGEDAAAQYLRKHGCKILERNWKCPIGEIDIIAQTNDIVIFVEVKSSLKKGTIEPDARVNLKKQQKLRSLAAYYLKHKSSSTACRFDVIAVWWEADKTQIKYIENAF